MLSASMVSNAKLKRASAAAPPADAGSNTRPAVRLFSGLGNDDIASIMALGVVREFATGQTIVRAGEPGTHLFLVKTGSVDYYRVTPEGRQVLIIRLSQGDTIGLGTLLDKPIGYIGTAQTLQETELYAWDQRRVRGFVAKHPMLAENALRISLEYIGLYSDRHLALVSNNAEDRLARTLTQLGERTGRRHPRGLEIQITNELLGALADTGSYTASRTLSKWEREGAIEKSRGKIVIRNPEKMIA